MALLSLKDLSVRFETPEGPVRAVDGLTLDVAPGETLTVVGESGSGKSQCFLAVMGLLARNGRTGGRAELEGADLLSMDRATLDRHRGREMAMVFQDPMTAFNPALRISTQLCEMLEVHEGLGRRAAEARALDMLVRVGIPEAEARFRAYPHELSGGMRQRVMIAMALLLRPKLLIADEPTTALDVTIQAQILALFAELKREVGAALVLITHDLGVVAGLADRVAVMYAGRLVELAPVDDLFARPAHPYTAALLASTPRIDRADAEMEPIRGAPPNLQRLPEGCAFRPRCDRAIDRCAARVPPLEPLGAGRSAACLRAREAA